MKEKFEDRRLNGSITLTLAGRGSWSADKRSLVQQIIGVTTEYARLGYRLTLRQLYYQLVQANAIPNHDTVYKKLSGILDDCRYSGIVDWDIIEDRGRVPKIPYSVTGIKNAIEDTIEQYRLNRQEGQPVHIELWTEKDAISNILFRVTAKYQVRLVVNKGYTSSSAAYDAYERFVERLNTGQRVVILYFGDHDPSGLDMIRDIRERMIKFLTRGERLRESDTNFDNMVQAWWSEISGTVYDLVDEDLLSEKVCRRLMSDNDINHDDSDEFEIAKVSKYIRDHNLFNIIPIGLTMKQVAQYKLPPNPAKITDPRAAFYIKQFGRESWEVDALRPEVLTRLVDAGITSLLDTDAYNAVVKREEKEKKTLAKFMKEHE